MSRLFKSDLDPIDWTFSEAPLPTEAPQTPSQLPPPDRQPLSSRPAWPRVLLVMLALLAVALALVLPGLEAERTRRSIEAVVAQQEQARLAGDQTALQAWFKDPAGGWAQDQLQHLRSGWQPAAFGLPGAQIERLPGTIVSYQVLSANLVRTEVARSYLLADGTDAKIALPQYYQYADGTWRQVPGPNYPTDDQEVVHGSRVDVHYNPADVALATSTANELAALLSRACADWNCPPDLQVAVVFGSPEPTPLPDTAAINSLSGCLTFQMLVAGQTRLPDQLIMLPAREWAGYPLDAAGASAVQRSAAVQALANVAGRLTGGTPGMDGTTRPFLYAFLVRELVRLGVESSGLDQLRTAPPVADSAHLWSLPTPGPDLPPTLLSALAISNRLMAGRPMADEGRLLHALGQAHNPVDWLQAGLGLTPSEAQAVWTNLTTRRSVDQSQD